MAVSGADNNWERIRQGVKDAENLIQQNKYNLSMMKCRQTLEWMVHSLCQKAGLAEPDLAASIDELYNGRWITKTTCEHYHNIRMLGNKAVHEGCEDAYDANQAFDLLSLEIRTFVNEYGSRRPRPVSSSPSERSPQSRTAGSNGMGARTDPPRTANSRTSGSRTAAGTSASRSADSRNVNYRSTASGSSNGSKSRRRPPRNGFSLTATDLIRLLIVLLCVIVIFLLVRLIKPEKENPEETTSAPPATVEDTLPETTAPTVVETLPETTPAPVYKTSDNLNVRSEPSTAGEKLGLLPAGTVVDYVEEYDDKWAIINYNGSQAYVSSEYLVRD